MKSADRAIARATLVTESDSPLLRLSQRTGEHPAFLEPHHVEAGERIRRLVHRAALNARVTMSYAWTSRPSGPSSGASSVTDSALDARRQLARLLQDLPRDCAGVVLDACGFLKGLQVIESERGWPRRSAKLVLRIGLDQLARKMGLTGEAQGPVDRTQRNWLAARPERFE